MVYSKIGLHLLKPAPDDVLVWDIPGRGRVQPQVVVYVGTYDQPDSIEKHLAYIRRLVTLLPGTVIGVRWWPDDNILLEKRPAEYAEAFFKLHVPGTILMVGNEDANNKYDPEVFRNTVRLWTEVTRLANDRRIPLGIGCVSTGNPDLPQYDLYVPLLKELQRGRSLGVVSYLRPNAYFVPSDPGAMEFHLLRHWVQLSRVARTYGVVLPPIFLGEIGAVRDYSKPEDGYRSIPGFTEPQYVQYFIDHPLPYPGALFSYEVGVYDTRWQHFAASRDLLKDLFSRGPISSKTLIQEWRERQVTPTLKSGVITGMNSNIARIRSEKSTSSSILGELKLWDPIKYSPEKQSGGRYWTGTDWADLWYQLDRGFVASEIITVDDPPAQPDTPLVKLPVDHVSQLGSPASRLNNDCPEAAGKTLIDYSHMITRGRKIPALTVNLLTGTRSDLTQPLGYIVDLLSNWGVSARIVRPMTLESIVAEINRGFPVIALVNYKYIGGQTFGHFVVIHGYSERGFWLHDPYLKGADFYITRGNLDKAMSDMTGTGNSLTYQGIMLNDRG